MTRQYRTARWRTPGAALTLDERQTVLRFNAYLLDLEGFILQEAEPLDRALLDRKNDTLDAMIDYTLAAEISYFLRQDDPACRAGGHGAMRMRASPTCPPEGLGPGAMLLN